MDRRISWQLGSIAVVKGIHWQKLKEKTKMSHFDLGRDLQQSDIVDRDTWPLDDFAVEQHVCCQICMEHADLSDVEPLTKRTGVFTGLVRCDMEAPVYVCLGHMDPSVFTPVVAAMLKDDQSIHL